MPFFSRQSGGYLMGRREEMWNGRTMPVTSS
jgi:hypothetical protein